MRVRIDLLPPINRALYDARIRADLTQVWLAEKMGVTSASVSMVESGHWSPPSVWYIKKAAQVFGFSLAEEQRLLTLRAESGTRSRPSGARWRE